MGLKCIIKKYLLHQTLDVMKALEMQLNPNAHHVKSF